MAFVFTAHTLKGRLPSEKELGNLMQILSTISLQWLHTRSPCIEIHVRVNAWYSYSTLKQTLTIRERYRCIARVLINFQRYANSILDASIYPLYSIAHSVSECLKIRSLLTVMCVWWLVVIKWFLLEPDVSNLIIGVWRWLLPERSGCN